MKIAFLAEHREFIPLIARWSYDEWSYLCPQRTLQDFADRIAQRANTDKIPLTLVACEGPELIGTVCLQIHDMKTRKELTPWLAGLFVAEPWKNQGVGKRLVGAIEKIAVELGVEQLYLYTSDAEDYYLRLGWAVKERIVYQDFPVVIMAKTLR
jgi:predicted N-acetyltransferase YhbS